MYDDPKRVRRPYGRVNLDEYESRLIDAVAEFTGVERAALLRQFVVSEALRVLGVDSHADSVPSRRA